MKIPLVGQKRFISMSQNLKKQHQLDVELEWGIQESTLSAKEKVELFACIKEAVSECHETCKNKYNMDCRERNRQWMGLSD